ncbi:hypothetical protein Poly24_36790 [Rosistilla carotiformis]|uniref:VWFA domain-containing protein n=1 Tax=Rosistilla carotiformis TaxID=2528017 RepID=A0A518JWP2_9BACT|nr:hypothetical protein [Rosistilla carotiformis]QDV69960.1 hypothetical protein Poly24_36790 [Rosistilla carotiformis]
MSSSAEGSSAAPLLPPTRRAAPIDSIASWNSNRGNRPVWRWSSRWNLLIGGVFAATALTAVLTWATTSIGRAPRVCVMLASTDYHANLDLPPNAMGDRAIGRLSAWVTHGEINARRNIRLARPPLELANRSDFERISTDPNAAISLTFLSVHGIHTPQGPALLAADAQSIDDAYPVKDLLAQIARFPEKQNKVLLLDCVHFQSQPSLGILLNDFARQIRDLEDTIRAIPNLVVLISSETHEQSWINPAVGTTNWANAFISAVNGLAEDRDRDGWIDLLEVHDCAAEQTTVWAAKVAQRPQHPWMLPSGEEGANRCRNLGLFPSQNPTIEIPALVSPSNNDRIARWFSRHDQLAAQSLHPAIKSPAIWPRFERTLLRYEAFERAGCESAADVLSNHLEDLVQILDKPTRIESVACRAGVLAPEMVGFEVTDDLRGKAKKLAALLSEMPTDEAADHWLNVIAAQPSEAQVAFLRRSIIESHADALATAFRTQVTVDRQRLDKAASMVTTITDPLQPIPQLGRVLQFLARDLPSEPLGSVDATRIARFLSLSARCDRIANDGLWWSPQLYRWVSPMIDSTDRQRRFAGDLLIGEAEARQRADVCLDAAETGYAQIDQICSVLIDAQTIVQCGSNQLSRLRELAAASTRDAPQNRQAIPSLYGTLQQIEAIVNGDVATKESQRNAELLHLKDLTQQVTAQIAAVRKRVDAWQSDVLSQQAGCLPDVYAALHTLGSDATTRHAAWESLCRLAASADAGSNSEAVVEHPISLNTIQASAALRGQLSLCVWPAKEFDAMVAGESETRAEVEHRLKIFATDSQWWKALATAGYQIGLREKAARQLTTTPISPQSADEDDQLRNRLECIHRMASTPPFESQQFVTAVWTHGFARFLAWQTERFVADTYWSLSASGPAYYARVAELLSGDIASLHSRTRSPNNPLLSDPSSAVTITLPNGLVWTTQRTDQINVSVRTMDHGAEGFATIWVDATGDLQVTQPTAGQRVCRPLCDLSKMKNAAQATEADGLIVHLERREGTTPASANVQVHGYFRGRRITAPLPVTIAQTPDVHIVQNPKSLGGQIAIRSDAPNHHATDGAITLVLDCSGSMGADRGQVFGPDTKYAHAVTAIESLLKDLPSGVKLSVWTFGQAVGETKTVQPAERSIRRIQAPIVWDPRDRSLRQNLIDAISYPNVEPWNESPLLAAMLAASNDLRDADGVRSLVVITDGADNRIATDGVANPLGLTPEQWLRRQFNGTGITVNVIGFRVDAGDKTATQKQLATVRQLLPPGRFVTADKTSELASALAEMLTVETPIAIRKATSTSADKTHPVATVPISPGDAAASWTPMLDAGLYSVATDGATAPTTIQLSDGEQLILDRSTVGTYSLWPAIDKQFRWCPQRQSGRWTLALAPQPISVPGISARRLVLWADATRGNLAIQRPSELWVEARDGDKAMPIRWQNNSEPSCDGYDLSVQGEVVGQPQFSVWISDRKANSVGALVRNQDFRQLQDLAPASWQLSEGEVRLKSAAIETHTVADRSGTLTPQSCLVLRGSGPRSMALRLRTRGLAFEGQDEQCFTTLGEFTLRQWPVTGDDVQRSLQSVELILVDQVKSDTERAGGKVIFAEPPRRPSVTRRSLSDGGSLAYSGVER